MHAGDHTGTDLQDERSAWVAEAFAIVLEERDFDVACAAELPPELFFHSQAATLDPDFAAQHEGWLAWLFDVDDLTHLLVMEQSCSDGVVLPWGLRGARVLTAPLDDVIRVNQFLARCPRHVAARLVMYVYWLLRCERTRRRGNPNWSPRMPLPPEPDAAQ